MNTVTLKPKTGVLVRHPDGSGHLAEAGESVVMSSYWRRRIADGDVEIATETTATETATESATETTQKVKK